MTWLAENMTALIAIAALLVASGLVFCGLQRKSQERRAMLGAASELLDDHARAVRHFVDAPEPSVDLKVAILLFSDAVSKRATSDYLMEVLLGRVSKDVRDTALARSLTDQLAALHAEKPELAKYFHSAVTSGMAYTLSRWPENACKVIRLAPLIADREREMAVVSKVYRNGSPKYEGRRLQIQSA